LKCNEEEVIVGLYTTALTRILAEMRESGFQGKSLCMIGKQTLHINVNAFEGILKDMGFKYDTDIWEELKRSKNIDSYDFFRMFGLEEVHASDINYLDGADLICDLNGALPRKLEGKFDFIIDGGTTEHIFDVANAIRCETQMLAPGGIIFHILPAAGYVNHGFYSFSPTFFQDFYRQNGVEIKHLDLEFMIAGGKWNYQKYEELMAVYSSDIRSFFEERDDSYARKLNYLIYTLSKLEEAGHVYLWCIAKKVENKPIAYPVQGLYQRMYSLTEE